MTPTIESKLPTLIFMDIDTTFKAAIEEAFGGISGIVGRTGRIECVPRQDTAFVSPANSMCFMDGGLDHTLSRVMFPGCETAVKAMLLESHRRYPGVGEVSLLGRPYLGLGSTISLRVIPEANTWLIVSPTMLLPQDVSRTNNAYTAMLAVLQACASHNRDNDRTPIRFCVVPALCCGYGKMPTRESAAQCRRAYDNFVQNGMQEPVLSSTTQSGRVSLYPCRLDEQPKYYENSEFFAIAAEDVVRKSPGGSKMVQPGC